MKILCHFNHLAPYRDDTLLELSKKSNAEIMLFVKDSHARVDNHSEWNYESPLKQNIATYKKTITFFNYFQYHFGFIKLLKRFSPDVLVGSSELEFIIAKILKKNIRIVSSTDTMRKGRRADKWWNRIILNALYSIPDAYWLPGKAGEKYFREYIGEKKPIYFGAYTNDAKQIYKNIRSSNRDLIREQLHFSKTDFVFLFVGKLIKTRFIEDLLQSADVLSKEKVKFLIIGDGEDSNKIEDYITCHTNLEWIKSVSLSQLDSYYACADAYIHPGAEPYSLALYEAAIAGLPMIASNRVGATYDCLEDGKNGFLFELHNIKQLTDCILKIKSGCIKQDDLISFQACILENRGILWASDQLAQACGFK